VEYVNYLFCVGFGLLGGMCLRLVTTSCSWDDFDDPCLCERDWNDESIFETWDEDDG
jgi:hypothetical protein